MIRRMIIIVILATLLLVECMVNTKVAASADLPLQNSIAQVRITKVNSHRVLLEWRNITQKSLVLYKLSYNRGNYSTCSTDIEKFEAAYCRVIWTRTNLPIGNIRITDQDYRPGDEYYVLKYEYQTHNGAYGPFVPK